MKHLHEAGAFLFLHWLCERSIMEYSLMVLDKKKQVVALLAVTGFYLSAFTIIMLTFEGLPDLELWLAVLGFSSASILTLIYIFKYFLLRPGKVKITEEGFFIRYTDSRFFRFRKNKFHGWKGYCFSEQILKEGGNSVELISGFFSGYVFYPEKNKFSELTEFSGAVKVNLVLYARKQSQPDEKKNVVDFFRSSLARTIAVTLLLILVGYSLYALLYVHRLYWVDYMRMTYLYLLGVPFLFKVFQQWRKQNP